MLFAGILLIAIVVPRTPAPSGFSTTTIRLPREQP
jgi:hypothetical protein